MGTIGFTPQRLDEALQYLHHYGDETTVIAGGTDLMVRCFERLDEFKRLMNICELKELKNIRVTDDQIEIGSLVTHAQLMESTIILDFAPMLADAAATVGSPQIRNRGTVGGNVANASPAGDTIPPLIALGAHIKLKSLDRGERILPLEQFFVGPGRSVVKKDELITGFIFTKPRENQFGSFEKLGYRKALAISTVNTAVQVTLEEGRVLNCRIVLGSVGPTPVRAKFVEESLQGQEVNLTILKTAVDRLEKDISPITDIRGSQQYRLDTAKELVRRNLWKLMEKEVGHSE